VSFGCKIDGALTVEWVFTSENELTITTFVDGPRGSYEAKRIFLRK